MLCPWRQQDSKREDVKRSSGILAKRVIGPPQIARIVNLHAEPQQGQPAPTAS